MENPIVFISYSWDDENHKEWVLNLANQLRKDGVDVILDRYYLRPGKNVPFFIENSLRKSNRVIIVLTPNYKLKAENRQGGVGQEFSLINNDLAKNITENEKIIPILKSGKSDESIPEFIQQYIYINFTDSDKFDESYEELLRDIYKEPEVEIPELGKRPNFQNRNKANKTGSNLKEQKGNNSKKVNKPIDELISIAKEFSSTSYSDRKEKASSIYEISPNIPLKEILNLTKEKNLDLNIASAISIKSYIENLSLDIGANPDVRSFIFYGINHKSSLLRYRIFDLISVSDSLKEDFQEEIKERRKLEKNKEVKSKIDSIQEFESPQQNKSNINAKKEILDRIKAADLETALKLLINYVENNTDKSMLNNVVILQAQHSKFKRDKMLDLVTLEESNLQYNRIAHSLINILDEI